MGKLFDSYDEQVEYGQEITICPLPAVFVSDKDDVFCYTGMHLQHDISDTQGLGYSPHYINGKHSTGKNSDKITGFYRIKEGCIFLDEFLDSEKYGAARYKKIDIIVDLPKVGTVSYSVLRRLENTRHEDVELTRAVFGFTQDELESVFRSYWKLQGYDSNTAEIHGYRHPRLTRSSNVNYCNITGATIPDRFPYISLTGGGYSYISLHGFFKATRFLIDATVLPQFKDVMKDSDVADNTLSKLEEFFDK